MKKILIYGLGRTGRDLVKFCKKRNMSFTTFDDRDNSDINFEDSLKNCSQRKNSKFVKNVENREISLILPIYLLGSKFGLQ